MSDKPIPIYNVIEKTTHETGLYKGYQTRITIEAPFSVFFDKCVGLKFEDGEPLFLKFDSATQSVVDGKVYTVLIRESFEPVNNKEPDKEFFPFKDNFECDQDENK